MEHPKISVIVPVYNAEDTIERCVDSILSQSFTGLELLLIDDGSSDGSAELCKQYVEQDARVRYKWKINGGVSTARNLGIIEAQGEYICFVDSDDWLAENALEILCSSAAVYHAEIVLPRCAGEYYSASGVHEHTVYDNDDFLCVVNQAELPAEFDRLYAASCCYSVCGRLFLRSFLNQHQIRFDYDIRVLEDFCFVLCALSAMTTTVHVNQVLYHYSVVDVSGYAKKRRYDFFFQSIPKVQKILISFLDQQRIVDRKRYYDLLISYWVLGIENLLDTENNQKIRSEMIRQCAAQVRKMGVFDHCTKGNLSRPYHVLFTTGSANAYFIANRIKQTKLKVEDKK